MALQRQRKAPYQAPPPPRRTTIPPPANDNGARRRVVLIAGAAVLLALARTVGWVAQWNEMIADPDQKIGRPRQLYTGATERNYIPVKQR